MPITDENHERNFITKLVNYKQICSIPNSMSVLDDLLPVLIDMSLQYKTGTINLVNPGLISHNEILEMYREIVDHNFEWNNFTIDEQNAVLDSGRSNNFMDTLRLEELYPDVLPIKDSVRMILMKMANSSNIDENFENENV
jgi:hypothetical protein